jgi:hypothetical protein
MILRLTPGLPSSLPRVAPVALRSLTSNVFHRHLHLLQPPLSQPSSLSARAVPWRSFMTVTADGYTFHFPSKERMAAYLKDHMMGRHQPVVDALVDEFAGKKMSVSGIQKGVRVVVNKVFSDTANDFVEDYTKVLIDIMKYCAKEN